MSVADIRARMRDVPGIEGLTMRQEGGKQVFSVNGVSAALGAFASDSEIEAAIRQAIGWPSVEIPAAATPLPTVNITETRPAMTASPAAGSFVASIRAMMDEARNGVAQARADGIARVGEAVDKLNQAKAATVNVAGSMAKTIEDEAASVLSELGQISNDIGG